MLNSQEGFIWLKLESDFFSLNNNLFMCASYIPPQHSRNSVSTNTDYFQSLTEALIRYSNQGNIMVLGDLNARIGWDKWTQQVDIPTLENIAPNDNHKIADRSSCDFTVNGYGKKLRQICNGFGLVVANGRAPGDRIGNFTFYNERGASVVDYVICDKSIKSLKVLAPAYGSGHTPMEINLGCKVKSTKTTHKAPLPPPPKFVWDPLKADMLDMEISSQQSLDKISEISTYLNNATSNEDIDRATKDMTDFLFDVACKCIKLAKKKKPAKKPKKKTWFNSDCEKLKKRLQNLSKLFSKNPKDPYI